MTPTARPVRHTLYGTIAGAACGALLFLLQLSAGSGTADLAAPPSSKPLARTGSPLLVSPEKGQMATRQSVPPPATANRPPIGSTVETAEDVPAPDMGITTATTEQSPIEPTAIYPELHGASKAAPSTNDPSSNTASVPDATNAVASLGDGEAILEAEASAAVDHSSQETDAIPPEDFLAAESTETESPEESAPKSGDETITLADFGLSEAYRWADMANRNGLEWPSSDPQPQEDAVLPPTVADTGDLGEPGDTIALTITVSSGDTLMKLLGEQDVPRSEAYAAVDAMRTVFDPRNIRPGHELTLELRPHEEPLGEGDAESTTTSVDLVGLRFEPSVGTTITLDQDENGAFHASAQDEPLVRQVLRQDGVIQSSLFEAGLEVGASQSALAELIRIFSYDVDFQRDIRKNDSFQIFYDEYYTEDGRLAHTGDVLYASMTLSGTKYNLYRFEDADGNVDYYNEKGEGVRKALLRTPINGARLSSGFGKRFHPVLGYSKMHKGVDFAAPRGTPIYAAGDGIVEKAGPFSSYGNYVRIRHNSEFKTAYAHMKGFAKGIKAGSRVKQGQIIGYVGTTGRSTGPHLHYEVLKQNTQVNPLNVRFPSGKTLKGTELASFKAERQRIDVAFQNSPTVTKVARAD
ncbi:peptidoglycan DD-metalloendopeptidase family protein [Rhodospirillum sp. A1_3_36]|uniref:peptidoglycan DD-metalloendopeptidase family protein n=1 Tax=Rhodospirillum sp. A1_3_36 TaxID=3391666 RepID=UPI0039A57AE1